MRRCGSRVRERLPTRSRLSLAVTAKVDNFVSVSVHGLPKGAKRGWPMKVARALGSLGQVIRRPNTHDLAAPIVRSSPR